MTGKLREQRFARHATGDVWDANHVTAAVKAGPWTCATSGCPLRYGGVKAMHKRRSRSGTEHTVNGSFQAVKGDVHDSRLDHRALPQPKATIYVDDGSRRHISRVRELEGPEPVPHNSPASGAGGAPRTEYEYGPDVHGLRALVLTAREYESNPDAFQVRKFRVPGSQAEYFWNELWTGPDRAAYQRARINMHTQVSVDGRAYFVEGFARDEFQIVPGGTDADWIKLRLDTDFQVGREEIQLHLPDTSENREHLAHVIWQTPLAIWAHRIHRGPSFVLLKAPNWRHVLADNSEGMVTKPRR